jgi:hypothetical protein
MLLGSLPEVAAFQVFRRGRIRVFGDIHRIATIATGDWAAIFPCEG